VGQVFTGGASPKTYNITNTTPYAIYELIETVENPSAWLEVNEFHLFDSSGSDLTADNAGLITGADEQWGVFYSLDNNIVDSSAIAVPDTVSLPGTPVNMHRQIFDVPTGTGDDALAIQSKIDSAAALPLGSKPVVHIPNGKFNIKRTIVVPAGSDMQLIGDGVGSGTITRLVWAGDTTGPLLHCMGPSRVTIKDMLLNVPYTFTGVEPLVIEDADQVGGRIYGNQFHAGGMDVDHVSDVGIFADGVENSDITIVCGGPGECQNGAIKAKGGPVLSSGGNTNGQISCLSGASGASQNLFSVTDGGRIDAEGMWYEGDMVSRTNGLIDLEDGSGKLSLACMAWYLDNSPYPIVHTNNFSGNLTLLLNHFNQVRRAYCVMEGSGMGYNVLGAYNDWGQSDTLGGTADSVWVDSTSPDADAAFFRNSATHNLFYLDNVVDKVHNELPDSASLLNDLAQLRAVRTDPPMDRAAGVTDVKLFRVSTWGTGKNAAAHFISAAKTSVPNVTSNPQTDFVTLFPTVVQQNYTVRYELPAAGEVTFTVYDVLGRLVSEKNIAETGGIHQSVFSVDGMRSGTYFLKFVSGSVSETKKFVVTH